MIRNGIYFLGIILLFDSCSMEKEKIHLKDLNGYWKIEKVEMPQKTMDYPIVGTIDYFEWKSDSTGLRKKIVLEVNGNMRTSNHYQSFKTAGISGKSYIIYENASGSWKEQIERLDSTNLVLLNEEKIKYFYLPYNPQNERSISE